MLTCSDVIATCLPGQRRRAVAMMRRSAYGLVKTRNVDGSMRRSRSSSADSQKFSLVLDASRSRAMAQEALFRPARHSGEWVVHRTTPRTSG
jgi:hypothetical protein